MNDNDDYQRLACPHCHAELVFGIDGCYGTQHDDPKIVLMGYSEPRPLPSDCEWLL